jgi:hypothetical protein
MASLPFHPQNHNFNAERYRIQYNEARPGLVSNKFPSENSGLSDRCFLFHNQK